MRGDVVYRVYALHEGREKDSYFGAYRTRPEAEAQIKELNARAMNGRNWAEQYHNKGFVVREAVVDSDFEIPSRPKPRDKYFVTVAARPNRPGTWDSTLVDVFRRNSSADDITKICRYERNYGMLGTFEPFRQGSREFALISRDYTRTGVLDLASGEVVAEEKDEAVDQNKSPTGNGFCPVGFFVPDWWDIHDGSIIPGSEYWDVDCEWPSGAFGFVWGCYWGDDSSWKVQHLDLSRVQQGTISRDERFGYVELATSGFKNPCLFPEMPQASTPPSFIQVSRYHGVAKVSFAAEMEFNLDSGKANEWRRLKIANLE